MGKKPSLQSCHIIVFKTFGFQQKLRDMQSNKKYSPHTGKKAINRNNPWGSPDIGASRQEI